MSKQSSWELDPNYNELVNFVDKNTLITQIEDENEKLSKLPGTQELSCQINSDCPMTYCCSKGKCVDPINCTIGIK